VATLDRSGDEVEELARAGLHGGFICDLPPAAAAHLVGEGIRVNVPAGALVYRHEESPRLIVVVNGLLRVFLASADGRQVTVRYARSGDVAGLVMVLGGPAPESIQAMTSSLVVALRVATLRSLLEKDPWVARACAAELTRQLQRALDEISLQAFLTVRQRLVRELLVLAAAGPGRDLIVRASQQELADAIGSVREVVTRNLHQLAEEGMVAIGRDEIVLRDPIALADVAHETGERAG
jgi:CRP/FNR family transcriptional regulator, cyclic AMP receptor protein